MMTSYCENMADKNIGGLLSKLSIRQNKFPTKISPIKISNHTVSPHMADVQNHAYSIDQYSITQTYSQLANCLLGQIVKQLYNETHSMTISWI